MIQKTTAPYGSWKSPITTELITAKTIGLGQFAIDGDAIILSEIRPNEGGRTALVRFAPGLGPVDAIPSDFNARTRVHEYGGGAFAAFDGMLYFVNFKDQHLYRQKPGAVPQIITPADGYRYADLEIDYLRKRLICIREDHTGAGEAINTIVALSLDGGDNGMVLAEGYNFFSTPRLSPDGTRLAWLCWNHPNMPWDGTELWVAEVRADGSLGKREQVAGGPAESVYQPEWSPAGVLHFVSDRSGWWNLYRLKDGLEPIYPMEAEFGEPQWVFGMRMYDFISEDELLCVYAQNGAGKLARLDTASQKLTTLELPYSNFASPKVGKGFAAFIAFSASEPTALVKLDLASGKTEILRRAFEPTVAPGYFSKPQSVEFPTERGLTSYGIFYPPANQDYTAPAGEKPPLIVMSHGGPTSAAIISLRYGIQYWNSRGFAILDVNYGGSTGYGREYRMRLNGNWGIVDVEDCCNGALWLAEQGLVDRKRMAITGGSAGGFTTLAALIFKSGVFSAGGSHFGVSDLEALATDTHKFESRYLDNLVGPYPERKDIYMARSPIHHTRKLSTPIILFQGDEDPVVPPNQSERMFEAARAREIPTAYLLFEGESHGFRKAENIKRALEAEFYFYSKIFKFEPADEIEPVEIENF
jgi:dipeptidyl aminopeptidase/acylaminoacyl peptidase